MLDQLPTDQHDELSPTPEEPSPTDPNETDLPVVHANWLGTKHQQLSDQDLEKLHPYFAQIPTYYTIRKTLENTTQYAKAVMKYHMT
jgi:hypothetical protein